MEPINIRQFRKKVKQTTRSLRHFLTRTENNPPKYFDAISLKIPLTPIVVSGQMTRQYKKKLPANVFFKKSFNEVIELIATL